MNETSFQIGENRTRPPYQVRTSRCSSCEGPISLYSEQSQLVVCQYCGENLDCSQEELLALGKPETAEQQFLLDLEQVFCWEEVRYKVIARLIYQLGNSGERNEEYLLFHPLQGSRWLSVYWGEGEVDYSLSDPCQARATVDPFSLDQGEEIITGDERIWERECRQELRLVYVDGALPWLATVGDCVQAIEYSQVGDSASYLTVERTTEQELEYSYSRAISTRQYRKAIGKPSDGDILTENISNLATTLHPFMRRAVLLVAVVGIGVFGFLSFQPDGAEVASFTFTPEQTKTERGVVSPSFVVSQDDIQKPFRMRYSGVEFAYPNLNILKVEEASTEFIDLKAWEKQEEALEDAVRTRVQEASGFYFYPGKQEELDELFLLESEGVYRVHIQFSEYDRISVNNNVSVSIQKNAVLSRYYLFMFGCCLWALFAWRKL